MWFFFFFNQLINCEIGMIVWIYLSRNSDFFSVSDILLNLLLCSTPTHICKKRPLLSENHFIPISLSECLNQMRHRPCKVKPIWSHTMCLSTALICPSYEPICVGHCLLDQHFIFSPQCSKSSCFLTSITPMSVSFVILLLSTAFTYGLCFLI